MSFTWSLFWRVTLKLLEGFETTCLIFALYVKVQATCLLNKNFRLDNPWSSAYASGVRGFLRPSLTLGSPGI